MSIYNLYIDGQKERYKERKGKEEVKIYLVTGEKFKMYSRQEKL